MWQFWFPSIIEKAAGFAQYVGKLSVLCLRFQDSCWPKVCHETSVLKAKMKFLFEISIQYTTINISFCVPLQDVSFKNGPQGSQFKTIHHDVWSDNGTSKVYLYFFDVSANYTLILFENVLSYVIIYMYVHVCLHMHVKILKTTVKQGTYITRMLNSD